MKIDVPIKAVHFRGIWRDVARAIENGEGPEALLILFEERGDSEIHIPKASTIITRAIDDQNISVPRETLPPESIQG